MLRAAWVTRIKRTVSTALLAIALPLAASAQEGKHYDITFVPSLMGNPFFQTAACGAAEAAKRLNVTFNFQAPQQYQSQLQLRVLDAVIAAHPDGILFTATDPVALNSALMQAKNAGIKIITLDSDVADLTIATANIQSDNVDDGAQAARRLPS